MSESSISDFNFNPQRKLSLSMPLSDEDKQINLTMRQPSFTFLLGNIEAKNGETLSNSPSSNPRIVFDTSNCMPHEASLQISRSSLYQNLKRDSFNLPLSTSEYDESNIWESGSSSQFYLSDNNDNSLISNLEQLNSSRWKDLGYIAQSTYNEMFYV